MARLSLGLQLRLRFQQGLARVRGTAMPVLYAALAGVVAYLIAGNVLGHQYPFFAPIGVWACLGFTGDRRVRRVAEMGIGVAFGVGFGVFAVHFIGSGVWQIAVVMCIAVLSARFVDSGALLATQAGTQAIVIVGLPMLDGGPLGRWTDALVGGLVALLAALIMPGDLRRQPRVLGAKAVADMTQVLLVISRGLKDRCLDDVEEALTRGRSTERVLQEWLTVAQSAQESARVSAPARKHRGELNVLHRQAVLVDRAVRTFRVLARRAIPVADEEHDFGSLVTLLDATALGTQELSAAIARAGDTTRAQALLRDAAQLADPGHLGMSDWQVQSLMMLMRSPIVDILEAAGMSKADAIAALPEM